MKKMGQHEIAQILIKHHPKLLSYVEIAELTNAGKGSVTHALRALVKREEIIYIIKPSNKNRGHWVRKYGIKKEGGT